MRSYILPILLLIGLCYAGIPTFAQKESPSKKSVYKELKSRSSASTINDMLDQAESLRKKSPNEALEKVKEALGMSIADQNVTSISRCYNLLGEINLDIGEWKLALENFTTANNYASRKKVVDAQEQYRSIRGMGIANLNLEKFDVALGSFNELLQMSLAPSEKVETSLYVSEVYYKKELFQEALDILSQTFDAKLVDPSLILRIDNQKAKIYVRLNQIEKATDILTKNQNKLEEAKTAPTSKNELADIESAKEEISGAYTEQKRFDEEIDLRENSIRYNAERENFNEVSKDKVELSKALIAKGETTEAIRELEEAASIADTVGDPRQQSIAYLSLAEIYERHGNASKALETYHRYTEAVRKSEDLNEKKLLEKSELIKTQRDIEELSKNVLVEYEQENVAQAVVARQRTIIYSLAVILLISGVTSYFIYKNALASKRANQLLALKSLRSQMNPHFIFNALNSVNHFVSQNDERTANRFLSEFSRLMRLVMENSQEDFIPLCKEEEIISLYLKLEHYRFRDKFDYEIIFDESLNKEAVQIPPMLVQPYIENAVWHGLRYKDSKGFLSVRFVKQDKELLICIDDDGIGRTRSAELKTENQKKQESTGLKNIRERLGIINKVYNSSYKVDIEDGDLNQGTKVTLHIPHNSKMIIDA